MSVINWLLDSQLHFGSKAIYWREIVGGTFGLTSAFLGMRRLVSAWPVGIIGDALLFTVFLGAVFNSQGSDANFYGQAGRNLLLIVVSIYGWIRWSRSRAAGKMKPAVEPRWTTTAEKMRIIPAVIIFYGISYLIFKALGETGAWLRVDTWIFTGTALATYGMSRGYIEFWLVWVAVDAVGVPFAFQNGYYPTGILYSIYLPFVIWGFFSWRRISKQESKERAEKLVAPEL
ncbi:MAG: nicotinamide mononucleotide transporter [Actinobacteria bacterium]|nr:nicotinamide mononucleotide transporter [Actinomycetota bacterium]